MVSRSSCLTGDGAHEDRNNLLGQSVYEMNYFKPRTETGGTPHSTGPAADAVAVSAMNIDWVRSVVKSINQSTIWLFGLECLNVAVGNL